MLVTPIVEHVDLRSCTRDSNRVVTTISITGPNGYPCPWVTCGRLDMHTREDGQSILSSKTDAVDQSHDTARAFRLPLVGFTMRNFISDGHMFFTGYVLADDDQDFRMPVAGWDPYKGAEKCPDEDCDFDHEHRIVPEGQWAGPKHNKALYKATKGMKVEVRITIPWSE